MIGYILSLLLKVMTIFVREYISWCHFNSSYVKFHYLLFPPSDSSSTTGIVGFVVLRWCWRRHPRDVKNHCILWVFLEWDSCVRPIVDIPIPRQAKIVAAVKWSFSLSSGRMPFPNPNPTRAGPLKMFTRIILLLIDGCNNKIQWSFY